MKIYLHIYLVIAMLSVLSLKGQEKNRSKVVDKDYRPLSGVSVMSHSTGQSVKTDQNGYFELDTVRDKDSITLSHVGFRNKTIGVHSGKFANATVMLDRSEDYIEEVVVSTGYYDTPRERATGSFVHIDQDLIARSTGPNIINRLEGVVPGLQFDKRSWGSTPNSTDTYDLRVRGVNSLSNAESPLIVLDDFPYDGDINSINPNDIQSITILKDAAAASIWGARAGNGVIVIKSKRGKYNTGHKIDFNTNATFSPKPDLFYNPKFIDAKDYISIEEQWFGAGVYAGMETNLNLPPLSPVVELLIKKRENQITAGEYGRQINALAAVDMRDHATQHLYQNTFQQQYALSASGGSQIQHYIFSAGFDKQTAAIKGNESKRLTLSAHNAIKLGEKIEVAANLSYIGHSALQNGIDLMSIPLYYPYSSLMDNNGNPAVFVRDYRSTFTERAAEAGLLNWQYRPLEERELMDSRSGKNQFRFSPTLNYNILSWLKLNVTYQYDLTKSENRNLSNKNSYEVRNLVNRFTQPDGRTPFPYGEILSIVNPTLQSHIGRSQLNITNLERLYGRIDGVFGMEMRQHRSMASGYSFYGYDDEVLTTQPILDFNTYFPVSPRGTARIPTPNQQLSHITDRFVSYYGNLSYSHQGKYTVTGSARWDASNLFGVAANKKGVPLWSLGGAWDISKESFYRSDVLPYLRVRGTYGYNGNVDKTVSAYPTVTFNTDFDTGLQSAILRTPGNRHLRWERVNILNLALEFRTKNNLLNGEFEWYVKNASDLLGPMIIDPTIFYAGNTSSFKINYADLRTNGIDLTLNSRVGNNDMRWDGQLLLSYSANTVKQYKGGELPSITTYTSGLSKRPVEGHSLDAIYSLPWAGLDPETGDPLVMEDGELTKEYTRYLNNLSFDQLINHGTAVPTYFGGLRNTLTWKSLSLSCNITFKAGYSFWRSSISYNTMITNGTGLHRDFYQRWQQSGDESSTDIPSFPLKNIANRDVVYNRSESLVERGDHIRLQDINLSYRFSQLGRFSSVFKAVNVFMYASNLGLIWSGNNKGLDPDYPSAAMLPPRSVSFGIQCKY